MEHCSRSACHQPGLGARGKLFLDLNWADGEALAHFESARWGRLLDLNSQTRADAEAFALFESTLPGLSDDSPFLPNRDGTFEGDSVSALPSPASSPAALLSTETLECHALPSSTGHGPDIT